jgi:nicotinamidase-related amidase
MGPLPLLRAEDSLLLIVDMQTRPAAACPADGWTRARDNGIALARAADALALPVLVTQQQPDTLGRLAPEIAQALPDHAEILDKTAFAATDAMDCDQLLAMTGRTQVLVCGLETHVAVLQTAAGLQQQGYAPFVLADGVCARDGTNHQNALERLHAAGVPLVTRESVLCEWLRDADHPLFDRLAPTL